MLPSLILTKQNLLTGWSHTQGFSYVSERMYNLTGDHASTGEVSKAQEDSRPYGYRAQ